MMVGMEIQERPYAGVYNRHYKFGCYRCTKVHEHGRCPELDVSNNSPNSSINSSNNNITNTADNDDVINSTDNNSSHGSEDQVLTQFGPKSLVTASTPFEPSHRLSRSPPASEASPLLFRPTFRSEDAISGKARANPDLRSRSAFISKRSREDVEPLIEDSLEKKRKQAQDKKGQKNNLKEVPARGAKK